MAKSININLASVKNVFAKLTKNLALMFSVIFFILLILEIFAVKTSVEYVLSYKAIPGPLTHSKGVRINFDDYDKVVKRIREAPSYHASASGLPNPFAKLSNQ